MKPDHKYSSNIVIRKFKMEDYKVLIAFWNNAKLPYKLNGRDSHDKIERELKQKNTIFLVAELQGNLVGSVFGTHDGRKGWINRLAVDPNFRKQGIARMLVTDVENRFSELGIDIVACLIEDWNTKSMQAFKRLGYNKHSDITYFTKRKSLDV